MKLNKYLLKHYAFDYIYPILDTEDKFIFLSNLKAGSKSIIKALGDRCIGEETKTDFTFWEKVFKKEKRSFISKIPFHLNAKTKNNIINKIMSYSDEELSNLFSFTVVRNPWDRVVSGFFYYSDMRQKWTEGITFDYFVKNILVKYRENPLGMYTKSVPLHETLGDKSIWAHFAPLYPRVSKDNKLFIDFVAKIENLKQDWRYICKRIDLKYQDLDTVGASSRTHYRDYYDEESKRIVEEVFKQDIELFKYKY